MYFKKLPEILYNFPFKNGDKMIVVRDITANVRVIQEVLTNITIYDEYDIVDGDTPEIISDKIYGTPLYHWLIMICNLRFDYIEDFPLPFNALTQYIKDKYGEDNLYSVHHYEDSNGFVVNSDEPDALPVSNIDYEDKVNESKRRIKIISKNMIPQIISEFNRLF